MPGEDEYWERIRERMEMGETEPEPEEKILSLDEELEELEKKIWLQTGRIRRAGSGRNRAPIAGRISSRSEIRT